MATYDWMLQEDYPILPEKSNELLPQEPHLRSLGRGVCGDSIDSERLLLKVKMIELGTSILRNVYLFEATEKKCAVRDVPLGETVFGLTPGVIRTTVGCLRAFWCKFAQELFFRLQYQLKMRL